MDLDTTNKMEAKLPPPVESDGMNVHLSYIRRDIDEIKLTLRELGGQFVTSVDYAEHLKSHQDHEERIRVLEESRWKVVGATGIIVGLITIIGEYFISHL